MWPVNYEECLLSIKEKLLIEEYLRNGDKEKALDVLRSTWKYIITFDPKRDVSKILENIQYVVKWIKSEEYKGQLPEAPPLPDRESLFWDWVCDYISGFYKSGLFECESKEEAQLFYEEFRKTVPLVDVDIVIVRDKCLNLFKIHNSPSRSNQLNPNEHQKYLQHHKE